jgi:hypothetical protein
MIVTYFQWYLAVENNSSKINVTIGGFCRWFRVAGENRVTFGGNDLTAENRTPFGDSDFQRQ